MGLLNVVHQLLYVVYLWVLFAIVAIVLAIQVLTQKACPAVPENHSVWVQHRDYDEDSALSQVSAASAEELSDHPP